MGYPAVTGYDDATGGGGPNGSALNRRSCRFAGLAPMVSLSPASLTSLNVVVGVTGNAKTVTVTNTGTATLNISSIATSGDFTQTIVAKSCGSTSAAGANCVIKVTFTPTQFGARNGSLTITDNASNSPQMVPLRARALPKPR